MESVLHEHLNDQITVVIRSVGERTESACVALVAAQGIRAGNVVIIREAPFPNALRSSFEAGLKSGRHWTLCVDADVLLRPNSISTLVALAGNYSEQTSCVIGLMLDKLTVAIRIGGIHLYRTAFLKDAILEIPAEGVDIRPENFVLQAMASHGYPWATVPYVVGIHDFGQYYEDIFRKCYVHANKRMTRLPDLLPIWRARANVDPDFAVAIEGLACGIRERGAIHIDKRLESVANSFAALGMVEKGAIAPEDYSPTAIEKKLQHWAADNVRVSGFPVTAIEAIGFGRDTRFTGTQRIRGMFRRKSQEIGFLRTILFVVGIGFEHLGLFVKRMSSKHKRIS